MNYNPADVKDILSPKIHAQQDTAFENCFLKGLCVIFDAKGMRFFEGLLIYDKKILKSYYGSISKFAYSFFSNK